MFFTVFLAVYVLGNLYIIYRIAHDLSLKGVPLTVFLIFYLWMTFLSLYVFTTSRFAQPDTVTRIFTKCGYIWLGVFSISLTYLLLSHILFLFNHTPQFKYNVTLITAILIAVSSVYSVLNTCGSPKLTEIGIKVPNLP